MTFTIIATMKYFLKDNFSLLDLLRQRFFCFAAKFENKKDPNVIKILLRIVNVLKLWIETHLNDFVGESNTLVSEVKQFATEEIEPIIQSAAANLINFLETKTSN